jgi:hypothetical protein
MIDISKLNQLDRIEYLLKEEKIERANDYNAFGTCVITSILFFILLVVLNLLNEFGWIIFFTMTMGIFAEILFTYNKNKEINKLNNEFFIVEIKPKGGSNGKERRS